MNNFRSYYSVSKREEANRFDDKWESVLFTGEFNPITRDEYARINQFNRDIIGSEVHGKKFSEEVDLGLILDHREEPDQIAEDKLNHQLNVNEKSYIATKFFGLKTFPINLTELLWLTHSNNHKKDIEEQQGLIKEFQRYFHNTNVLIVLRPEEKMFMNEFDEMKPLFKDEYLNIGFMIFEHDKVMSNDYLKKIPCDSNMIKAICLLDYEKPYPEALKTFAHKYKLEDYLDFIKTIHFKCRGERYDLAFQSLFPSLKLNENDEQLTIESNAKVALNLLKAMYTKNIQ
jgi:hypothetical protein